MSRWRVMAPISSAPFDFADVAKAVDPVEIDDMVGLHEAHVQHRHQRLAAGQKLGVVETAEQGDGVVDGARVVVAEGRWLHRLGFSLAAVEPLHSRKTVPESKK